MANYNVTILDGQGSARLKEGTYTVSVEAVGFDNTTLSPTSYTAPIDGGSQAFTVSASGTLTFTVNETGEAGGTAVTGGQIVMTDSTGVTQYGAPVDIESDGTATFEKVPFGDGTTPYTLYFKQLSSDDTHYPEENVITVSMTSATQTQYVKNDLAAESAFTLYSEDYSGLPVASATLTFTEQA